MDQFFTFCKVEQLMDARSFVPNSIELDKLNQPMTIGLQHFVNAFEFLSRKSLKLMYQEVLDNFYIVSKRLGMHISGPTIANLFEQDDPDDKFEVSTQVFIHRLGDFVGQQDKEGRDVNQASILQRDLQFLATKYLTQPDPSRPRDIRFVNYLDFIQDYNAIENPVDLPGMQRVKAIQSAHVLKYQV